MRLQRTLDMVERPRKSSPDFPGWQLSAIWILSSGNCAPLLSLPLSYHDSVLLLCHLLPPTARASLIDYFHTKCPDHYIVAVVAHEAGPLLPGAQARVVYSPDHGGLAVVMRQCLAA